MQGAEATTAGEKLPVETSGDTITVGNQALVVVGDILTATATMFHVDT